MFKNKILQIPTDSEDDNPLSELQVRFKSKIEAKSMWKRNMTITDNWIDCCMLWPNSCRSATNCWLLFYCLPYATWISTDDWYNTRVAEHLRNICAAHLRDNEMHYEPWLCSESSGLKFLKLLSDIRTKGLWNHSAMDIIAYIICNICQCKFILFRSFNQNPNEKIVS